MKIEQNGAESAELSANGSFVVIHIPVQVIDEVPKGGATLRYGVGSFVGRPAKLLVRSDGSARASFRIPKEIFRARQRLHLEVLTTDDEGRENILWAKRYEAAWLGSVPHLAPMADNLGEPPEIVE